MRILGIDPGSQITGFGVIEKTKRKEIYITSGCIRIGKLEWPKRLQQIFEGLSQVIQSYAPDLIAVERIFVHKNVSSALKLGQARGVALLVAAVHNLSVSEYTPRQIKKAVVGFGGADKSQIQQMMRILLKLDGLPQADAADALAVAYCHCQTQVYGVNVSQVGLGIKL